MDRLLVLFAREPAAGRVKTRLAATIGAERAAELYRAFLADLGSALALPARWETRVAAADPESEAPLAALFPRFEVLAQAPGDLGARMAAAFDRAAREGFAFTVIAGSDAPLLSSAHVGAAFDALESADAAFSPAPDGGFSLVALRAGVRAAALFANVRWSTEHALADCRANAAASGLAVALLAEVADVDRGPDVAALCLRLRGEPELAPATARLLASWGAA